MKRIIFFGMVVLGIFLISSCAKETKENVSDYTAFLRLLSESGFQYIEVEADTPGFLAVERKPIIIENDIIINIYEYNTAEEMEKDAVYINKNGHEINFPDRIVYLEWASIPHFYKKGTLIINYVGENELMLNFLTKNFGVEFAGYGYIGE